MTTKLPSVYQEYIAISRYARYLDESRRRETWEETVSRYIEFFQKRTNNNKKIPWQELKSSIINLEVMPSMRCLMSAGEALESDQVAGYNCSYITIDSPKAFDEIMYVLMCGTGVGFSVESRYTNKLPEVPDELHDTDTTIVFKDSKIGWASGYREFISLLYSGKIAKWDVSKIRLAGSRLKTFGGRASGPEPLIDLIKFTLTIFNKARGRKLTTLECHDIVCKIADIVVCGGVRRSALISLSDLNDDHIRHSKSGEWWTANSQRALANNSAVYEQLPDMDTFLKEWIALYMSRSGERGMFSRAASQAAAAKYGRRDPKLEYGTNPCCLPGDTVITVRDHGNIKLSDFIKLIENNPEEEYEALAYDIENNSPVYTKVITGSLTRSNAELIELVIFDENDDEQSIKLTPDHQVYTENRGYVRADEIDENDSVIVYT